MEPINIKITKAEIRGFAVTLGREIPTVSASIVLLTEGGKEITSYSISSDHWQDEMKFHLPVEIVAPILSISKILERIVSQHCNSSALGLTHAGPGPVPPAVVEVPF
jgi:hypothetical protein